MIRGRDVVWVVWEEMGMKGRLKVGFQTTFLYLWGSCAKPTLRWVFRRPSEVGRIRVRSPRYVGFQTTLGQRSKAALMRRLV